MDEPQTRDTNVVDLATAVQHVCAPDEPEGAVCTGFVVVSEWVDLEGRPYITQVAADPRGGQPPTWRTIGWLSFGLSRFT